MQARSVPVALRALCIIFAVVLLVTSTRAADHEILLHDFDVSFPDGTNPTAGLILDAAGNLYGTTYGVGGSAIVFELSSGNGGGWTETIVHNFADFRGDGYAPYSGLMMDGTGNLYGTTNSGGIPHNIYGCACGTVFKLSPSEGGWSETQLHIFVGGPQDGGAPGFASVVMDAAGNVYGTTELGGLYGDGIVFKLSPLAGGGWTETVLHNFGSGTDGNRPEATLIIDAAGNLYGTTYLGGVDGRGTVFELSPAEGGGWTETVLHNFSYNRPDGAYPQADLMMDAAGNLYGATHDGGAFGYGVAFKLSPHEGGNWTETVLHSFGSGSDGKGPYGDVVLDGVGNLFGTTFTGGSSPYCPGGCGVVWEISQ